VLITSGLNPSRFNISNKAFGDRGRGWKFSFFKASCASMKRIIAARLFARPAALALLRRLTDEETAALLKAAPDRHRIWYETALGTGFRLNELLRLRVRDLDLFGPSLFLAADFSEDRKEHRQPVTRELANKLRTVTTAQGPEKPLLGIPKWGDPASYINADYVKAGVKLVTPEGKATWHSLGKAFVNAAVRSGGDLKTIMTLARRSSAQLSMETYASADPVRLREATAAAGRHVQEAISKAACCTGVARKVVGDEGAAISASATSRLPQLKMVGATGLEPVTSWV